MPLTHTVLRVARETPDRPAIVAGGERLSYAGLVADSRRMVAAVCALHAAQARPPTPAAETGGIPITAISSTSAFHTARIVAGLAGYRAVSATIDPRWPLAHRVQIVVATGIGVVIADDGDLGGALAAAGWTGTLLSLAEFRRVEDEVETLAEPPAVRGGDEPFLMLFSSGTTRNPKAFLKTRDQYRANFAISSAHLEPLPGVVTVAPGPLSYSLTLYALIECLASGGTACLADRFDPLTAGRTIEREAASRMVVVPAMVRALAYAARRDPGRFASLALIVTGGANLSASVRRLLAESLPGVRLISYYGAAEIGFIGDSRDGDGTLIDIYRGVQVRVLRDDETPTGAGELGTIWVKATACSTGYLAGTASEVLRGADGWATVHDQGRWVDGRLALVGRAGDIAITAGHKVSLLEVERAFDEMPGLGAVAAVAIPDERRGSAIALVIECPEAASADLDAAATGAAVTDAPMTSAAVGADAGVAAAQDVSVAGAAASGVSAADVAVTGVPAKADLAAYARSRLAPQFVPSRWYAVPELPRTVGGKVRRGAVAELIRAGQAARL